MERVRSAPTDRPRRCRSREGLAAALAARSAAAESLVLSCVVAIKVSSNRKDSSLVAFVKIVAKHSYKVAKLVTVLSLIWSTATLTPSLIPTMWLGSAHFGGVFFNFCLGFHRGFIVTL